ncbi:hypothetical protein QL285_011162 [Trifolium repens]|nr:hypothetical protein QL285_011162 [Trifolium repens]
MTCVRLLEILPVLVDKLWLFGGKEHRNFTMLRAVSYLLNLFKGSCDKTSASTIMTIENLITSNGYALEELTKQNFFSSDIRSSSMEDKVSETDQNISDGNIMPYTAGNSLPTSDRAIQSVLHMKTSKETEKTFQKKDTTDVFNLSSQKRVSGNLHNKFAVT